MRIETPELAGNSETEYRNQPWPGGAQYQTRDAKKGRREMRRTATVLVVLLALGAVSCASIKAKCPDLTGYALTVCEVREVVAVIEAQQPKAFAALDALGPVATPDVRARIERVKATWPALHESMQSLIAALEAGQEGDIANVVARAVAFYVDLSALVVQVGGKALPGLPRTSGINAVR